MGFVRTANGNFWLAYEYQPSLLKVAAGKVLARYVSEGVSLPETGYPVEATLPAIYASRKTNRGFEGLALIGDGKIVNAVLQSLFSSLKRHPCRSVSVTLMAKGPRLYRRGPALVPP